MTVRYHHRRDQQIPTCMCQRDGIENGGPPAPRSPAAISTRPSGTCSPAPSPRSPPKPRYGYQPSSSTGRPKPTHCAPPTSSAPSTTLTWPAAATWPSTPPTGWSPAPSKPTGTPPCERSATRRRPTTRPASEHAQPARHRPARHLERPSHPQRERKRIARPLLTDVTVSRAGDTITAHVRLAGGQDRTLTIPAPLLIGDQRRTPAEVLTAIDELLDRHTTGEIAGILNQHDLISGTGEPFHRLIVDHIIRTYRLRSRRQRLRATGMLTISQFAAAHGVSSNTIKSLAPGRNCQWHPV